MGVGGRWVGPLRSPSASSRSPARAAGCPRAPPRRPPAPAGSEFSSAPPPASCSRPLLGAAAGWRAGCGGRGRLPRSGRCCRTPERPAAPPRPRRATAAPPAAQDQPGSGGLPGGAGEPQAGARAPGAGTAGGAGRAPRTPGICNPREILRMLAAAGLVKTVGALRDTWRAGHGRVAGQRARDFTWIPSAPPWLHGDPG